ncbi:retrovirus-related pol polyprotein from transposon TNT 1-94, partial [Tanacetum coccineum]
NQTNGIAGTKDNIIAGQVEKKIEHEQEYILIPICTTDPLISQDPKVSEEGAKEKPTEMDESGASDKDGNDDQATRSEFERLLQQEKQTVHPNNTNSINTVSIPVSTAGPSCTDDDLSSPVNAAKASNAFEEHLFEQFSPFKNSFTLPLVSNVTPMDDTGIFGNAYDDEDVGAEADLNNLETTMIVKPKKVIQALEDPSWVEAMQEELLPFKLQKVGHWLICLMARGPLEQNRIEEIRLFLAYASFMGFIVYQMDVKSAFLHGTIKEEVYVCQPPGFEDSHFPDKVYKVEKALYGLHQAPRAWYETLSTYLIENGFRRGAIDKTLFIKKDKGLQVQHKKDGIIISQDKYVADILKKFNFATVKIASTPIETNKALVKDEEAEARIFRYLKGQPKLGLWYPRDSPFDLEPFLDSDYARASLDRKSTIGGCQFIGKRLILWQCKKQTIVANSTTEAEYVAAANCCGQNLVFHSKTKHIKIWHHFIRDCYEKKLIQVIKIHIDHNVADLLTKAFDVSRFNFIIASIGLLNL